MTLFRTEFTVEGLGAVRVLDKLKKGGVELFRARTPAKNRITFEVAENTAEKVFAILRGSCYNVVKTRTRGLGRLREGGKAAAGLLAGLVLFCAVVGVCQTRVLKIEVVGSGSYYAGEVEAALARGGVKFFSRRPADSSALTAEILALPRVSYCAVSHSGGVLTVEVQVSDENAALCAEPFLSPVAGTVEELVVVRGTALVQTGDRVEKGQTLVEAFALYGEEKRTVVVIARAKLSFPVSAEYGGTEEEARAAALLEYGQIENLTATQTETGWRIDGTAFAEASLNL